MPQPLKVNLKRTVIVVPNVLSSLASLAMACYGALLLMLSRFDPMRTDDFGATLGLAPLAVYPVVPTYFWVASARLV